MSLPILVAQDKWQEFDDAWNTLMAGSEPIDDLLQALRQVATKKKMPRCLPMVKEHAELLAAGERNADAARLVGAAISGGAPPGELGDLLVQSATAAWSTDPEWKVFCEVTGFGDQGDLRSAWDAFERLKSFQPGTLLFHPGGWGTGEITSIDLAKLELKVRFAGGRNDRFPLKAATEIFEHLPESDLRALYFRDEKGLKKKLKNEPLDVLRAVLERHDGRATTVSVKNALMQVGVEGGSWSAWWRKTRKLAESSEWYRVTGTPARGDVQLLLKASNPADDARKRFSDAPLGETLKYVRDAILTGVDAQLEQELLELLRAKAEATPREDAAQLAAWVFHRDRTGQTSPELAARLAAARAAVDPEDPTEAPALWALFQSLATAREQETCVPLLAEVHGEEAWLDEAVKNLAHAPSGMIRPLCEALIEKRPVQLMQAYHDLLARPLRSPEVLIALARLVEAGKLTGDLPAALQRAQSLLALATFLYVNRRSDAAWTRAQTRLTEFLAGGEQPVLRRLLEDADYAALKSIQRSLQRGVDEGIDNLVTDMVMHSTPDSELERAAWFWENESIWTTRTGREKRVGELKHLVEVLIPKNEDALGRAAAMGDLSENFEWTSAIEEQRNLADKRSQLENEISRAEMIENAPMPEGVVCPGTRVRYKDLLDGSLHRIDILGPWDTDDSEQTVSYRAPLAWGLLGKQVGEGAIIQLPSGEIELEVLEIDAIELG